MEIKIQRMNHQEYCRLVDYVSEQKIIDTDDEIDLMHIKSIGAIKENPPVYHEVVISTTHGQRDEKPFIGLMSLIAHL